MESSTLIAQSVHGRLSSLRFATLNHTTRPFTSTLTDTNFSDVDISRTVKVLSKAMNCSSAVIGLLL